MGGATAAARARSGHWRRNRCGGRGVKALRQFIRVVSRPGGNYHNSPRRLRAGVLPARALSGCRRRRWQSPRATTAVGSALRWSLASFLRRRLLSMTVAIPSTSTHPMGFACLPRVLPPRKGSAPTRPRIGDHSYLSSIQETGAWAATKIASSSPKKPPRRAVAAPGKRQRAAAAPRRRGEAPPRGTTPVEAAAWASRGSYAATRPRFVRKPLYTGEGKRPSRALSQHARWRSGLGRGKSAAACRARRVASGRLRRCPVTEGQSGAISSRSTPDAH